MHDGAYFPHPDSLFRAGILDGLVARRTHSMVDPTIANSKNSILELDIWKPGVLIRSGTRGELGREWQYKMFQQL
jgi:hypothetical protein